MLILLDLHLEASGKLGLKTFKAAKRTAREAVEAEWQWKQMTAAGANLQTSSKGRPLLWVLDMLDDMRCVLSCNKRRCKCYR